MQYNVTIRKLSENDLSAECPFLRDDEELELRLGAFIEDLKAQEKIIDVELNQMVLSIQTTDLSEEDLKSIMEPFFGEYFEFFRLYQIQ